MRTVRAVLAVVVVGVVAACSSAVAGQGVPGPSASGPAVGTVSGVAPLPSAVNTPSTVAGTSAAPPGTASAVPSSAASPALSPLSSLSSLSSSAAAGSPPGAASSTGPVLPTGVAAGGAAGSAGIGDPYYPASGNGGYQVDSYDIDLAYDPASNQLSATTTITASVTERTPLGRFHLDLQPTMRVSAVTVNGAAAGSTQQAAELVVSPASALPTGSTMRVVVRYAGKPTLVTGGTANLGDGGWYRTPSGGAIAIGEPYSGSAWYPVNEHPSDPATYRVTATVPAKWSVISNGLASTDDLPAAPTGTKVYRWVQQQPITSYESTIYIDTFTTVVDKMADGKPIVSAFAPSDDVAKFKKLATDIPQILQVLGRHFGPYPFSAAGGIFMGQTLGFALETATRPVYPAEVDTDTIVHELAHQWFGDDVVIKRWSDICLNECFASYGPWLWHQDVDRTDLDAVWVQQMAEYAGDAGFWSSPLVDMGPGNEFTAVYSRGPLAIHALRKQMGETAFAALLKGWPATFGGRAASWSDFVGYANKLSGQDLTGFIDAWFVGRTVPAAKYLHPGGIG